MDLGSHSYFLHYILDLKESLLELHNKVTKANCSENSDQMRRLLETFLIVVKHGSGSKVAQPADICGVSSQVWCAWQLVKSWGWGVALCCTHVQRTGDPQLWGSGVDCYVRLCFLLLLQVLLEALQTAHLSTSCRKTLLDVVSALLLVENVSLPEALIEETIEKVIHSSSSYLHS